MLWEWPQITMALIYTLNLVLGVIFDGDRKTGKYSAGVSVATIVISAALLYFGGFWTVVRP
jgi:hypothetical protein